MWIDSIDSILVFFFFFVKFSLVRNVFLADAAYVGLATVAGFIWWFVYSETGPKLPYAELVSFYFL